MLAPLNPSELPGPGRTPGKQTGAEPGKGQRHFVLDSVSGQVWTIWCELRDEPFPSLVLMAAEFKWRAGSWRLIARREIGERETQRRLLDERRR